MARTVTRSLQLLSASAIAPSAVQCPSQPAEVGPPLLASELAKGTHLFKTQPTGPQRPCPHFSDVDDVDVSEVRSEKEWASFVRTHSRPLL